MCPSVGNGALLSKVGSLQTGYYQLIITYFPLTLREAPCLNSGEEESSSCKDTNMPGFIPDDAIKPSIFLS